MTPEKNSEPDFPYEIVDVDPAHDPEFAHLHKNDLMSSGLVKVGPKGYMYPKKYKEEASRIYNMKIVPGDVFVGGFPRSGTHFTQMAVWLITNGLNYAECKEKSIEEKYHFLERHFVFNMQKYRGILASNSSDEKLIKYAEQQLSTVDTLPDTEPRHLKTHLPLSLLPPTLLDHAKMVFIARDPRDTIVSYYHVVKSLAHFHGDFKTMWSYFSRNMTFWGPYFELVKEAWNKRDSPNLLFIFYENLLNDRLTTLRRISNFFGKQYSDEQLTRLAQYLEFDNLKNDVNYNHTKQIGILMPEKKESPFIRKGKAGGWREHFDEEMSLQVDCRKSPRHRPKIPQHRWSYIIVDFLI